MFYLILEIINTSATLIVLAIIPNVFFPYITSLIKKEFGPLLTGIFFGALGVVYITLVGSLLLELIHYVLEALGQSSCSQTTNFPDVLTPETHVKERELFNACYTNLSKHASNDISTKDIIARCMIQSGL